MTALDTSHLVAIAHAIAHRQELWRPIARHDPERRWFTRRYRTVEVEAWLLTWTMQQGIELHDHGGSVGAIVVVEGNLTELFTDVATGAGLTEAHWRQGSVHSFGPTHVHGLRNLGPGPATSIHVYSPPLTAMTYYDPRPTTFMTPLRVEPVTPPPPADGLPVAP